MMRCVLFFILAVTEFSSFCTALSSNFGHPNEGFQAGSQEASSFGEVHIPLGDGNDESGSNVWSQVAALDAAMYTSLGHALQGDHVLNPYADPSNFQANQQQLHQAYHLPPAQYDLPPSHYNPADYANYNAYETMPPMSSNMPYQSYRQPYEEHAEFTGESHADEEPQLAWTTANSTGEMPVRMSQAFDLPESTQALDRLSLGGLSRIHTGGRQDEDAEEGSSSRAGARRRDRGKGIAAGEEDYRLRQPQTARVPSIREVSTPEVRMPSTARLAYLVRQQERQGTKNMVEEQFIQRRISRNMHEQLVAAHVCEIKITHPGLERAIGRKVGTIVEGWNDARYLYDFHGWNALYRSKVGSLRRRFYENGGGTDEQLEWFLMTKFRDITITYHGPLADAAQEQQQNQRAAQVWEHFRGTRLARAISSEAEVTIPLVAHYLPRYKCRFISMIDSMTLVKRYLRSVLQYSYLDIEHLESLLAQYGSEQAQEND